MRHIDILVVGLGAHGSSILYEAAKQAKQMEKSATLLGIDQYVVPHTHGSSHGESRMFRTSHPAKIPYVELAKRSKALLLELEKTSKQELQFQTGLLTISKNQPTALANLLKSCATEHNIKHKMSEVVHLKETYQSISFVEDDLGFYEEETLVFFPEKILIERLKEAKKLGAEINFNEKLLSYSYSEKDSAVIVETDKGKYSVKQLFLATGHWLTDQAKHLQEKIDNLQGKIYWFEVEPKHLPTYQLGKFPITHLMRDPKRSAIIFPALPGSSQVKMFYFGDSKPLSTSNIDKSENKITEEEMLQVHKEYVAPNFIGISSKVSRYTTCRYTMPKNNKFLIEEQINTNKQIIFISACMRQGFKYSFVIGQSLAEFALTRKFSNSIDVFKYFTDPGVLPTIGKENKPVPSDLFKENSNTDQIDKASNKSGAQQNSVILGKM